MDDNPSTTIRLALFERGPAPAGEMVLKAIKDERRKQLLGELCQMTNVTPCEPGEPTPFMSPEETAFLDAHLRPEDHVWEWGSGDSTRWMARRVRHVTAVEHQSAWAAGAVVTAPPNVSVLYIPPDLPYTEGTDDDGDDSTFRRYVQAYAGRDIDVVVIDGRARVACARWVAECSVIGPNPGMRVFLHDAERVQYDDIWKPREGWRPWFREVGRVGRLLLLEPNLPAVTAEDLVWTGELPPMPPTTELDAEKETR